MPQGALPNLLVLGAMKCGTSSLHYYLDLHPQIQMSQPKELHFFLDDAGFAPGPYVLDSGQLASVREQCNWRRGSEWYQGHFSAATPVRGESTVAYTYPWYRGVAERAADLVPDARLVYVVRDPIERMVSHYLTHVQTGKETRPLAAALGSERNWYLGASSYHSALAPFLAAFPREQLLVLREDDLRDRRRGTLRELFGFLGVDAGYWSDDMETMRNRSTVKGRAYLMAERLRANRRLGPVIQGLPASIKVRAERLLARGRPESRPAVPAELRARLLQRLEPEITGLESLTGWDLSAWRTPA